jgi:alanine racemase
MNPTSRIEIDLGSLDSNLAAWRKLIGPQCSVCAVLKADAYGLGAVQLGRRLATAGVKTVAVYSPDQATAIANAGLPVNVLMLMPVDQMSRTDPLYRIAVEGRLHLTVHSTTQLDRVETIGLSFGVKIPVHVEVDTGLSRGGMLPEEADRVLASLTGRKYVRLAGIFTHAASASDDIGFTDRQLLRFDELVRRNAHRIPPDAVIHFAGTHAALRDRRYHKAMVRIGLGLLGYGVSDVTTPPMVSEPPKLRPVVRWLSQVVHVHEVPPGTPVGYAGLFTTDRPTRLGVVPVGYADGYPLALSNKGVVRIAAGERDLLPAPVRGRVNMDQIIVDLTELPGAAIGSEVELYAADPHAPNALPKLAELAGSNCYEMLCRLSSRLPRRYVTVDRIGRVVAGV